MFITALVINYELNIGQLISGSFLLLLTILTWLIKDKIGNFELRLEKVEDRTIGLAADTQKLIGFYEVWNGKERRK